MKKILCVLFALGVFVSNAQDKKNIFTELYKDFLKYGTVYAAGDVRNAYENSRKDFKI